VRIVRDRTLLRPLDARHATIECGNKRAQGVNERLV
jgi:hypothetical protein